MTKKTLLILNRIRSVSSRIPKIISHFGDIDAVLDIARDDLEQSFLLKKEEIDTLLKFRDSDELRREEEIIEKENIEIVSILDQTYPSFLKQIPSPPLLLYIRGRQDILSKLSFAIVGTRLPTLYGIAMAEKFSFSLASLGFVIVSGLARGIDAAAHRAALKCGETVAVLGSGLCNIYPKEHKELAKKIAEQGVLISEFSPFEPPLRENFPRRNRIISGLSKGVLVVEASSRSGALITARYALEQNREVFALPGQVSSPLSRGTHSLIKQGAKLVDSLEDIIEELNVFFQEQKPSLNLTSDEKAIFDIIGTSGIFLEELIARSGLQRGSVTKAVVSLQIKGLIKERSPLCFSKISL